MRRYGQRIDVRSAAIAEDERLHAAPWPGVLDREPGTWWKTLDEIFHAD